MELLMTRNFNGISLDCYQDSLRKDDFWATREQIGRLLEYAEPKAAIANIHARNKERLDRFSGVINLSTPSGGTQPTIFYDFKGLLEICRFSNQPRANAVMDFLWEIADEVRRTGSYQSSYQVQSDMKLSMTERVLRAAGIKDNQLALALDHATQNLAGFSPLAISGTILEAPTKRQLLTPTEIGRELGFSAKRVNEILAGAGFQHKLGDKWEPLEPGMAYAVMIDTGKIHSDGTPVRQLKWDSSILNNENLRHH